MVSSYTANLASSLTAQKQYSLIEKVEDLVLKQKEYPQLRYGAKVGGSTFTFFKESANVESPSTKFQYYKTMYEYMKSHPDVMMSSNPAGKFQF